MKVCVGCTLNKSVTQYYAAAKSPDGLNKYCKACCKVNRALEAVRKRDKRSKISVRQYHRVSHLPGVKTEPGITLAKIFKKDLGICHFCNKWVQPRFASPDHFIPLSKGGHHLMSNLRLTHLKCNLRKGAKVPK